MEVKEAICQRNSIRSFQDLPVPDETIKELVEYANKAPSAGNLQPRDFIAVNDAELKRQLADAALNQRFIAEAPVVMVVCANLRRVRPYGKRGEELYCIQDCAAAIENLLLLVEDKGLAACWVGAFNETKVSQLLNLPSHIRPVAIIPIGYPAEKGIHTPRKDLDEILHFNTL